MEQPYTEFFFSRKISVNKTLQEKQHLPVPGLSETAEMFQGCGP